LRLHVWLLCLNPGAIKFREVPRDADKREIERLDQTAKLNVTATFGAFMLRGGKRRQGGETNLTKPFNTSPK